ncbi:MAG TPA: hypothetical protein VHE83_15790 [Mycobacteriales bacterium]|nr:hypothetical protein [Mycobacteriales bacterium]
MERDHSPEVEAQDTVLAERIVAALASRRLTLDDLLAAVTFDDDGYFVPMPRQAPDAQLA